VPVNLKKGSLTLIILVENAAENDGDSLMKTQMKCGGEGGAREGSRDGGPFPKNVTIIFNMMLCDSNFLHLIDAIVSY
jgi:hypothetical protein